MFCTKDETCEPLKERTLEMNSRGKGFAQHYNDVTDFRGVTYRVKDRDPGVFINFCPFCGADHRVLYRPDTVELPVEG